MIEWHLKQLLYVVMLCKAKRESSQMGMTACRCAWLLHRWHGAGWVLDARRLTPPKLWELLPPETSPDVLLQTIAPTTAAQTLSSTRPPFLLRFMV